MTTVDFYPKTLLLRTQTAWKAKSKHSLLMGHDTVCKNNSSLNQQKYKIINKPNTYLWNLTRVHMRANNAINFWVVPFNLSYGPCHEPLMIITFFPCRSAGESFSPPILLNSAFAFYIFTGRQTEICLVAWPQIINWDWPRIGVNRSYCLMN